MKFKAEKQRKNQWNKKLLGKKKQYNWQTSSKTEKERRHKLPKTQEWNRGYHYRPCRNQKDDKGILWTTQHTYMWELRWNANSLKSTNYHNSTTWNI